MIHRVLILLLLLALMLSTFLPLDTATHGGLIILSLFGVFVVRPALEDMAATRKQSRLLPPAERKQYVRLSYFVNIATVGLVGGSIVFVIGFIL